MAKDILGEAGLHFDELNKLRVLDPEVTQQTIELKEECKDFVDKIGQFQKIVGGLIELVDQLAKEAENEKMKYRVFLGHWCSELAQIYSKTERSPTAATPGTNS
ncbi:intraflagellar transport protein 20 homolog isoform X2 [Physeter macrocephalus]|uniref:Intraflagellar transport protein 20 homolog isoform X2 n=1 Tax=Physeter macrocephalus TaxID=9755 RepID=A0A2Y9SYH3_PHYMC|nr:intraflagellar transport protein 20 homolog isoform X2 [Physeter catodon]XP_058903364.1 intraflagellar transport protein 20 homolog isoform X3 [Kogia breviceps]XP_058903365.1 intraflagellar transport protein 20 homolog isoform X3 [Kogia breviceps]|eukprot:XP_023983721.1 intraflagellar transport protein 20 homolog isoform X2 [Physeter catodon]